MTDPTYTPSDAAKAYADKKCPNLSRPFSIIKPAAAEAFDAGVAYERESRRPRVITTAAELDALPTGSVVLDADGDSWQKRTDRWAMVGIERLYSADHVFSDTGNHPVTLLAEAPDPEVTLIADLTAILTAAGIPTAEAGAAAAKVRDRMRGES